MPNSTKSTNQEEIKMRKLIVEAPEEEAQRALAIVKEEMENACKMKVTLIADGKIAKTWYDAH